jgi:hypothetical protein
MILNKRNAQTARWDHSNNKWSVGTREYQWFDEITKEESPWMDLDSALLWIKERDQEKILESQVPPEKNSNSSEK